MKVNKKLIYLWASYMLTHESVEMKKFLKYGTPSDRLILLSEQSIKIKGKQVVFPISLNRRSGQKQLFEATVNIGLYVRTVPVQAHTMLLEIRENVKARRSDTQTNIHIVAEAVLHRAACEFKHEVLFAFDSINEWIKAVYGKELGYLTIRKALEVLQTEGYFNVIEWGVRGNRSKATKIEILASSRGYILTYTSKVDMWIDLAAHGMNKVYSRESTTRQDVLEAKFHHFADQMAEESQSKGWAPLRNLFGNSDIKLTEVVELDENGVWTDEYIDRLLGGMVHSLQEDGTYAGTSSRRL